MHILLFFIDGFGIGLNDSRVNPIIAAHTPVLDKLFKGDKWTIINTDTSLGVKGLPQSATGQTTILTGINAAKVLGHHQSGFPGPTLKKIIAKENIFIKLKLLNKKGTFANAYTKNYIEKLKEGNIKASVTTECLLASGINFRLIEDIKKGKAVYQEFTNKILIDNGYKLPALSPEQAAKILANIVKEYDFTLYEYFQTDIVGHKQNLNKSIELLEKLDIFIGTLLTEINLNNSLIIITSDHGNIEDISVKTHTYNPVPTFIIGKGESKIKKYIKEITDITPAIISLFK